jgi:hypothetical protein
MQLQNKIWIKNKNWVLIIFFVVLLFVGLVWSQIPPKAKKGEKSYLNQDTLNGQKIPRGWRNNNPGNLIKTMIQWKGKLPYLSNTDSKFEQFVDFKHGIRALIKDLTSKIKNYGSIAEIIKVYAPDSENDTQAYINAVCQFTGFSPNQALSSDRNTLRLLTIAITAHENGKEWAISPADYETAYLLI